MYASVYAHSKCTAQRCRVNLVSFVFFILGAILQTVVSSILYFIFSKCTLHNIPAEESKHQVQTNTACMAVLEIAVGHPGT